MVLLDKITKRNATVGVIGLGYVGLPLVIQFVKEGYKSIGFDVDATDHSCYDYEFILKHAALVVDTRNAMNGLKNNKAVVKA